MKHTKRFLAIILAIAMAMTSVPMPTYATEIIPVQEVSIEEEYAEDDGVEETEDEITEEDASEGTEEDIVEEDITEGTEEDVAEEDASEETEEDVVEEDTSERSEEDVDEEDSTENAETEVAEGKEDGKQGDSLLSEEDAQAIEKNGKIEVFGEIVSVKAMDATKAMAAAEDGTTYVLAGSDFQARDGRDAGAEIVSGLLDIIDNTYAEMDGFLFAGDYDVNYGDSANGKAKLQETVQSVYGASMHEVYVQGNHDNDSLVGKTLSESGNNDTEEYGVFVINEKDYMWYNNEEATIKTTANNLEAYLNAKRNVGYTKPIFVVSHLPLHYCMRTREGGNDGMHANYIFDVLNEAGNAGLNIFFLFGHNHSHGWDDYLGGAAIFLTEGDKINIAQNSTTVFEEETLAFTYMNPGYVGYYGDSYTSTVDKTLSMTTFAISDNKVVINRFDSKGTHNLKSEGVYNVEYPDETYYSADTTTVASPYTLYLSKEITPAGEEVVPPSGDNNTPAGRTYTRVANLDELVSGEQYLLIENGNTDYFMLPESTSNPAGDRVGYRIEETDVAGGDTIVGDYSSKEWTLTGSGSSWVLGTANGNAYMQYQSSSRAYARISSTNSSTFTIGGTADSFTFITTTNNTTYVFDHSSVGLINGYVKTPETKFYIYRLTDEGEEDTSNNGWAEITAPEVERIEYQYTQVENIEEDKQYVIVGDNDDIALIISNNAISVQTVKISGNTLTSDSRLTEWLISNDGTIKNGDVGLSVNGDKLGLGTARNWVISENGDGTFEIYYVVEAATDYTLQNNLQYSDLASENVQLSETNYYYKYGNEYYRVYVTRTSNYNRYTYTLYYKNGNENVKFREYKINRWSINTNLQDEALYTRSSTPKTYYYLENSETSFVISDTTNIDEIKALRLYGNVQENTIPSSDGVYVKIVGDLTYNVAIGTFKEDALAAVKGGIDGYEYSAMTAPGENAEGKIIDDIQLTWTLDESYDGITPGEYAVTIAYNGINLGVAKVVVPSVAITGYSVEPAYGVVYKETSQATKTGSYIYVQLEGGKYYQVPVTVSMLTKADGTHVSTGVETTYENLTLTYNGQVLTNNYTLKVVLKDGNHYPEYPHEGAVKVNKTATGIDFQASGVAKVELSASGVPVKKGADVIIMLDTSSSMNSNKVMVNGEYITRLEVMKSALKNMVTEFKNPGEDGEPLDIRVAIADFNKYYTDSLSPYYIDSKDHLAGGNIRTDNAGQNNVYTGGGLTAAAFVDVHEYDVSQLDNIKYTNGTNYDYAFDAIYQLGDAITTDNANKGLERDLYVVFMSDGAPFQYNYFSANSSEPHWNNWLQGTLTDDMKDKDANNSYYNEFGKHWMAEAIKGDPANFYDVIRKNNAADDDNDTWVKVQGLGATVYSIGFCLKEDAQITVKSMESVLQNIATSSKGTYHRTDTYEGLSEVFTSIGSAIAYAASNARFIDTMGSAYSLQIGNRTYLPKGETDQTKAITISPTIEVKTYDIYTAAEVNGTTVTESMIGDRKGTYTTNEVVIFSADGTKAYSTAVNLDGDEMFGATAQKNGQGTIVYTISDEADNIIDSNKVICAKYFWYNTGASEVRIDRDNDGVGDYTLAPETFYWNIDTVKTQEIALSYYVYLEGAMEGEIAAGSYATNESAILYYTNYLGKEDCQKVTTSPMIAWESANVSYAFYLVNDAGEVVVNQTTGTTGTFANKIAVTSPVVYKEVLLNNIQNVESLNVATASEGVLPDGYELYDTGASYTVKISSNATGSWEIVKGDGKADTTYVTNFGGAQQYSNKAKVNDSSNDYTHTVVWFAVVWKPRTIDDVVVIDYGLPVSINVLGNDMFGDYGELNAIGSNIPTAISRALYLNRSGFSVDGRAITALSTNHGEAVIKNGEVQYQLSDMDIDSKDTFAYEVNYKGTTNPGYYYGSVSVIPATTIYYEDDFLTFSKEGDTPTNSKYKVKGWTRVPAGSKNEGLQDEDRPGKYSLPEFDANNVYGYDNAYKECATYSMGSAVMTTLNTNEYATAGFSFNGTGFDVISLTSNQTGTMTVQVTDQSGNKVKNLMVDTYYGYSFENYNKVVHTYNNGTWSSEVAEKGVAKGTNQVKPTENLTNGTQYITYVPNWVVSANDRNALYQVPVIKVSGLEYGKYNVTITATYSPYLDHTTDEGYTLYLDAIRVYDPANNGVNDLVIKDAYIKDNEAFPQYFEIRNEIIDAQTFDLVGDSNANGVVFIDPADSTSSVSDYKNYGPNNEVYLADNQAISFKLNLSAYNYYVKDKDGNNVLDKFGNQLIASNVADVQIGLKSATGEEVKYKIYNPNMITDISKAPENTVKTSADMYYSIKNLIDNPIVIKNTSDSILSLTNIKVTLKEEPTVASRDIQLFISNTRMLTLALRSFNKTETEMLIPEIFEIVSMDVALGDKTNIIVTTSNDVDYLYANELTVTKYTEGADGTRTFVVALPTTTLGEKEIEIKACNNDGAISEAKYVSVNVTEKESDNEIKDNVDDGKVDVEIKDDDVADGKVDVEIKDESIADNKVNAKIITTPNIDNIVVNGTAFKTPTLIDEDGNKHWDVEIEVDNDKKITTETYDEIGNLVNSETMELENLESKTIIEIIIEWIVTIVQNIVNWFKDLFGKGRN